MSATSFAGLGLWANLGLFALAAALVWAAGSRLAGYLDSIADRTGMGQAFTGMLLMGTITSLPEISAVSTSAAAGNASLAVNNLVGSVAFNVVLIVAGDAALRGKAITAAIVQPITLMQGVLVIIALVATSMAVVAGDVAIGPVGGWTAGLALYGVGAFWLASRYARRTPWQTVEKEDRPAGGKPAGDGNGGGGEAQDGSPYRPSYAGVSLRGLILRTLAAAGVILAAGYVLSNAAEAIAGLSGIREGFIGLILLAFATSLPELSSIIGAVRLGRYEMALGDVFGTNLLTVGLLLLADAIYAGGPILNRAGPFEAIAALLASILTGIYLIGLLEHEDRRVGRLGFDSLATIVVFVAGLTLLYFAQPA